MYQNRAQNLGRRVLFLGSVVGLSFLVYETAFSADPNLTPIEAVTVVNRDSTCEIGDLKINQSESIRYVSFENGKKFSKSAASDPSLNVKPGPAQIHLAPHYKNGDAYVLNWKVWIDADGNGEYVSAEEVLSARGNGAINRVVNIPHGLDAKARMRVAMSFGNVPALCVERGNDVLDIHLISESQMSSMAVTTTVVPATSTATAVLKPKANSAPVVTAVGSATTSATVIPMPIDLVEPAPVDSAKLYAAATAKALPAVKKFSAKSPFIMPELPASLDRTLLKDVASDEQLADLKGNILLEVMDSWSIKAKPLLESKVFAVLFQNGNMIGTASNYLKLTNQLSKVLGAEPVCAVTLHHRNLNSVGDAGVMKGELIRVGHPIFGLTRVETPKDEKPTRVSVFQSDVNKNALGSATAIMCWGGDAQKRDRVTVAEFQKTIPWLKVKSFEFPQPKFDASIQRD
jgi:hypothetical protein